MCFFGVVRNLLLIVASLALLAGCSISYSSGKSSDSSTSSFSSGGGECEKADKEIDQGGWPEIESDVHGQRSSLSM